MTQPDQTNAFLRTSARAGSFLCGHGSACDSERGPTLVYAGGPNLYVNLTSRCSSSCAFCLREFTWEVFGYSLWLAPGEEPDARTVIAAIQQSRLEREPEEVVFTGIGEPTLRLDVLLDVLRWLSGQGMSSRLDTNGHGQLLNPGRQVARELAAAGLRAASVSLNAADSVTYQELCRPGLPGAFPAMNQFIADLVAANVKVTATMVDVASIDRDAVRELARKLGAGFRVRPLISPDEPVPCWPHAERSTSGRRP
ncbi:MAG TPA: TatD family nuclease-associated radical SAM protein [Thermoleophilia bacterium]